MSKTIVDSGRLGTLLQAARIAQQRLVYAGDHAADLGMARSAADYTAAEELGRAIAAIEGSGR